MTQEPKNITDFSIDGTPILPENPLGVTTKIISVDENQLLDLILKLRGSEKHITDLAEKLGVGPQWLGHVLAGRKKPGPKLIKGLGVVRAYRMFDLEVEIDES